MRSTISSKGQVTVPVEVRERLGLVPGTPVEFELKEEGVLLRKGISGVHPVDRVWATLRLGRPVDEVLDEMRGPRPRKRWREYCLTIRRKRDRDRLVADFLIGAHAQIQAEALLSRDRGFFRSHFKKLRLIDPSEE
jgi:AbrB family looped-hinge helix DNA binding protein